MKHCASCRQVPVVTEGDLCTACEDQRTEDEQTYRTVSSFLDSICVSPSRATAIALCLGSIAIATLLR